MTNRRELVLWLGSAVAAPRVLRAQQKAMPVVGVVINVSSPRDPTPQPGGFGFRQGLSETGYVEGENVAIERHYAEGRSDLAPTFVADLVGRKVDVIAAIGAGVVAAKNATSTIPIVFFVGTDPVATGLVSSLARPGGNLTGVTGFNLLLMPKRLELLCDLVPQARVIALLVDPNTAIAEPVIHDVQEAVRAKGVQLQILQASSESEIDAAFASLLQQKADGLLVGPHPLFAVRREQIFALASRHAVPAIYDTRVYVEAGGLMSYAPSPTAIGHQVGLYVGKILNGAKPADLPVEQPTRFELVVNLKTAKSLGLTVPSSILARADEVIE